MPYSKGANGPISTYKRAGGSGAFGKPPPLHPSKPRPREPGFRTRGPRIRCSFRFWTRFCSLQVCFLKQVPLQQVSWRWCRSYCVLWKGAQRYCTVPGAIPQLAPRCPSLLTKFITFMAVHTRQHARYLRRQATALGLQVGP